MGRQTSYNLVGATTQAAVPLRAQSASATCALARYDVRGLTARGASLRLARSVVLWVGG